jgi:hypothetical protein
MMGGQIYTVITIIKIKELPFCQMWANRSICSYSDFNLAYVAEFQYKTGYAKKNRSVWKSWTHFLLTVYILYKRTKFPSNSIFTSQSHKVAYFYDFPFYVILSRIRKEHYSSIYLLLYHCANDWFFGQLHKCSLHHKNMRLCGFVKWRHYSKGT